MKALPIVVWSAAALLLVGCDVSNDGKAHVSSSNTAPKTNVAASPADLPISPGEKFQEVSNADLLKVAKGPPGLVKEISEAGPRGPQTVVAACMETNIKLSVPEGARAIAFQYALSKIAWDNGGKSPGGCFQMTALDSGGQALGNPWQRCLRPLQNPLDRPMKAARVPLPAGTSAVNLKTTGVVGGNSAWGWTYWGRVGFVMP